MHNDAQRLSINLGRRDEENPTNLFVKWTVNTGRIIIVLVELLTLAALGYRFVVDKQIVDIHDKIDSEQRFVSAQASSIALYKNLQSRLDSIKIVETATDKKIAFLKNLVSYLNTGDFQSTSLSVGEDIVTIDGQTFSIFTLNGLIAKLKENQDVVSISIDELASLDQGIRFKVTTRLNTPTLPL